MSKLANSGHLGLMGWRRQQACPWWEHHTIHSLIECFLGVNITMNQSLLSLPVLDRKEGKALGGWGEGSGSGVEHTSDREKRSAFIDGNSFVHSDTTRTLKGLWK